MVDSYDRENVTPLAETPTTSSPPEMSTQKQLSRSTSSPREMSTSIRGILGYEGFRVLLVYIYIENIYI